jgi:uncharacterized protein (TIGR02996 family)
LQLETVVNLASPELKALLQRCREAPADDMPRLVLADWLDENEESDRATFIRVQIALSHPTADALQQQEWKRLEQGLLRSHADEWFGDLQSIHNGLRYTDDPPRRPNPFNWDGTTRFVRGFIHYEMLSQNWLLDPSLRNWLRSPAGDWLEQVNLIRLTPEAFERCTIPPEYSGKIKLNLSGQPGTYFDLETSARLSSRVEFSVQDWQRFFRSSNFLAVRSLTTDGGLTFLNQLGQADVRRLVALKIRNSESSEAAARILVTIPFQSLSSLDFGPVSETALRAVVACPYLRNLTEWNLIGSPIGDAGLVALCESPLAESLSEVSFPNTGIGDVGIQALVQSPLFAKMNSPSLNLMMNQIGNVGVQALAESEQLLRYRELVLRENRCGDDGVGALANSEFAANLTYIDFWRNRIGDAGAVALASGDQLGKVADLCVKENRIGSDGMAALFERFGERAKV